MDQLMACRFGAFLDMQICNPPIFETIWIILISLFSIVTIPHFLSRLRFRNAYKKTFFHSPQLRLVLLPGEIQLHFSISCRFKCWWRVSHEWCFNFNKSEATWDNPTIGIQVVEKRSTCKCPWRRQKKLGQIKRISGERWKNLTERVNQWIFISHRIYLSSWEIQHSKKVLI